MQKVKKKIMDALEKAMGVASRTFIGVVADIDRLKDEQIQKLEDVIGQALREERILRLFDIALKHAGQGKLKMTEAIDQMYSEIEAYLVKNYGKNPQVVGLVDGMLYIFVGIAPERGRKVLYKEYVRLGKVIGVLLSIVLTLGATPARIFIGAMPVLSRLYKYLSRKVEETKKGGTTAGG